MKNKQEEIRYGESSLKSLYFLISCIQDPYLQEQFRAWCIKNVQTLSCQIVQDVRCPDGFLEYEQKKQFMNLCNTLYNSFEFTEEKYHCENPFRSYTKEIKVIGKFKDEI